MRIDDESRWIDMPLDQLLQEAEFGLEALPPALPQEYWELAEPPVPGDDLDRREEVNIEPPVQPADLPPQGIQLAPPEPTAPTF